MSPVDDDFKQRFHDAILHACKAEEIVVDELPKRLAAAAGCGCQDTHHARTMRVILALYLGETLDDLQQRATVDTDTRKPE